MEVKFAKPESLYVFPFCNHVRAHNGAFFECFTFKHIFEIMAGFRPSILLVEFSR